MNARYRNTAPAPPPPPPLDVSAPRSMQRAGKGTALLLVAFLTGLCYLAYTLVTHSPYYMAKTGKAGCGIVCDRTGDVLFDGTKPLSDYGWGHFADVGNLIGDTSGQMNNTVVSRNIRYLSNYSFTYGTQAGTASLKTTLSHSANRAVYDAFGGKNGTAVAYNWQTGEVLVCVSKPCVDPALGYDDLDNMPSGSLLHKAFIPTVPGSTQKVSTLIAAYETMGVDKVNALEYACEGKWLNANGQQINCHNADGHGMQTLSQAFANSCNPFFAQLVQSKELPLSKIIETYTRMGYAVNGEDAKDLDISGLTAAAASTTLTDDRDFDTQWGCLGQGTTLVSPVQLMLWEGAVASGTGTAVCPYLVESRTTPDGHTFPLAGKQYTGEMFSPQAAQGVRDVMTENAANNYGYVLGGYRCGVKSGTAQMNVDGKQFENSLLTGFCLDESCPVAFCVMIEERVSTDVSTAQIVRTLLDHVKGE